MFRLFLSKILDEYGQSYCCFLIHFYALVVLYAVYSSEKLLNPLCSTCISNMGGIFTIYLRVFHVLSSFRLFFMPFFLFSY